MLKSIELSGFKSFAKKGTIEFKSAVTAIVGPNGSGKSNVAEAFRFVLGEQSIKSMRGKKGEDLIWNGSHEQPKSNRALVKAVFDNSKKMFGIDFDEVSIERAVNRDGVNEYSINGTQVRLKDIIELLAKAHIGASGHHIISQGEADRILLATIKERRSMLEDSLGLKIYQYKKQESERKLEKTFENIREVESLRREIAPHLRFLKKQVEKVSKADEIRENLISIYREYLKREKIYLDWNKKIIEEQKDPLQKKLKELDILNEKAKQSLANSEKRDSKSDELLRIESELKSSRGQKDVYAREAGRIEGEISANKRLIEKAKERAQGAEHKMVRLKDVEDLNSNLSLDISRAEGESSLEELKKILLSIRQKIASFIENNRDVETEVSVQEILKTTEDLEKNIKEIETKINLEEEKIKELDALYLDIRHKIEKEKDSGRAAEKELFRISSERSSLEGKLDLIKMKENQLKVEADNWAREVQEGGVLVGERLVGFAGDEIRDNDNRILSDDFISNEDRKHQDERRREIEKMKIRLEELGTSGGEEMMKEYRETNERDVFLEKELNDLHLSSESLNKIIKELEDRLNVEFKEGIRKINKEFNNLFSMMFGGGEARLEVVESKKAKISEIKDDESLVDYTNLDESEDETDEGIDIFVSLPKKRIKGLVMLSGGERALTSIALLFAISQVNPPPFIILDETDAALDEANSKKYGDMIESLSKFSQLILITHNRETMSRAGVIYGVTMGGSGISKLLSIAFDEAVSVAK